MSKNWNDFFNTEDHSMLYDMQDIHDNKIWAALSYVSILFILPLFVNGGKSKYGRFHANQGFLLFLMNLVCSIATWILSWIPFIGTLVQVVLSLAVLALMILGIINAVTGKAKELPLIGGLLHVFDK
ncbi:MAG: hypothetical protein LUC50_01600 [Ruminococcus sp.]|nr:hypothetical protein [Ruminococcus sp.]